ncbi:predicted protein [Nematostella vectensis]|uniref:Intermembrane lipid transfer protein VPS13-like C-terminal domain-containing protein n=1 Tax=Nematostella vectensis TaxID=45351 RepID=A7S2Q0_NEMVE|nr:predicted protein [Nematostella vectensis]|eukprot:XP_001634139.1 predicted protein [Nematostella vectensis]
MNRNRKSDRVREKTVTGTKSFFYHVCRSAEQGGEDIAYRMRLPRFTAPGQPVTPYSEEKAKGYGILKSIYTPELSGDVYVSDMTVSNEKNGGLVLLTSKRIIMVHQSRFWKEWKVSWMCAYDDVTTTPWIVGNTLVIKRKRGRAEGELSSLLVFAVTAVGGVMVGVGYMVVVGGGVMVVVGGGAVMVVVVGGGVLVVVVGGVMVVGGVLVVIGGGVLVLVGGGLVVGVMVVVIDVALKSDICNALRRYR